jgi:CRISPR-associated protein (TIGR02584 family)
MSLSDAISTSSTPCNLLCVTGLTPQVVSECFFALAQAGQLANKVLVLSTSKGAEIAAEKLPKVFDQMCAQYGWPMPELEIETVGVPALCDIRSDGDNRTLANKLVYLVGRYTQRGELPLVACISGGRKSMSALLALSMALYARPEDRIAHVLVDEAFETHPDFYYPEKPPRLLRMRDGRELSSDTAAINLAFTPFPSFRSSLFEAAEPGGADFARAVRNAQTATASTQVVVDLDPVRVQLEGVPVPLMGQPLAVLAWLCWRTAKKQPAVASREFIQRPHALLNELRPFLLGSEGRDSLAQERFDLLWRRASFDGDLNLWYAEKLSRIREGLRRMGGAFLHKYDPQSPMRVDPTPLRVPPTSVDIAAVVNAAADG